MENDLPACRRMKTSEAQQMDHEERKRKEVS